MKVDEQFKCKDCDNYNQCNYYHNRRETSFICKEFQNQWGFIKELEKIKDEIEKLEFLNIEDGSDGYDKYIEQYEVLKTINKRITELKGENK